MRKLNFFDYVYFAVWLFTCFSILMWMTTGGYGRYAMIGIVGLLLSLKVEQLTGDR